MAGIIYLVDDDAAVRDATTRLLRHAGHRVKCFEDGEAFLATSLPAAPACILLDVRMPGLSGIEVLRAFRERGHTTPVIFISAHGDIPLAVKAMKEGAFDFIEKPYDPETLFAAIGRAARAPSGTGGVPGIDGDARGIVDGLPRRQREVLRGIVQGKANKLIAYELGLSVRTVEAYRAQLQAQLGVRGSAELVKLGLAAGIDREESARL